MIRLRKKIPAAAQHSVVHGIFKICRRGPPKPCLTSAGFLSNSLFILWNIVSETWHDLKARNYLRETLVALSQELNQKCSYNCQQKLYPHLTPPFMYRFEEKNSLRFSPAIDRSIKGICFPPRNWCRNFLMENIFQIFNKSLIFTQQCHCGLAPEHPAI